MAVAMNAIDIKHRIKRGGFTVDVDEQIPDRGVTGLFGASGSGKTTLLRCIAGLEPGSSTDRRPPHRRRVGVVFQEPQLFSHLSVAGNIRYGHRRASQATTQIEKIVDLMGLDNLLDRRTDGLSGGEAQRVAIARALCQSPSLVVMDEPLSALDQRRKNELLPFLDRLHAELSVPLIYVSHNINEVCRLCDHLMLMNNGRIVANGDLQSTLLRLDLPELGTHNAGAVLNVSHSGYDDEFDLTAFKCSAGELWVPGRFSNDVSRLRVAASDVSIARSRAADSSILNRIDATIDAAKDETAATMLLRLKCGEDFLIARITCRSWQQLGLAIGDAVVAQIKSVTVRY